MTLKLLDILLPFILFCLSIQQIRDLVKSNFKMYLYHYYIATLNLLVFIVSNFWLASSLLKSLNEDLMSIDINRNMLVLYAGIPVFIICIIVSGARPVYLYLMRLFNKVAK